MSDILTVEEIKQKIVNIDIAIDFLISNPTAEYTLDTGQGTQRVKRQNIRELRDQREYLNTKLIEKTRTGKWGEVNRC